MCSKREPNTVLQAVADLHDEITEPHRDQATPGWTNPMQDFAWAGARVFYGTLENI